MNEEELILQFMKQENYVPMKARELASIFNIHKEEIESLKATLKKMEQEGKISKNRRNKYAIHEIITIVGTFKNHRSFGFVIPDHRNNSKDIFISKKYRNGAKENDKVVVQLLKKEKNNRKPEGKIIEVIGQLDGAEVDFLSIIKEYKLPYEFPKPVIKEAKKLAESKKIEEDKRVDFRDQMIFTIDGEDAKDLDDAISIQKTKKGNFLLSVHIADVSHYVKENSNLDKEARLRGTSVYMLNRVIPMLPKELSNGICSLNAGEDRYTLSVLMEVNAKGEVISSDITKGIINVTKRMSYQEVQKVLEGKPSKDYRPYISQIELMAELAHILEEKRRRQGYLALDIPETNIIYNSEGKAIKVEKYETSFAHQIIEQFMLLTNEVVAEKFYWLEAPFIYRVHESPDPEKIKELNKILFNFGYQIKGNKEEIHPKAFSDILEKVQEKEEEKLISNFILRTLKIAKYEAQNKGHFGIAGKYYCHFTSPIRRYPDLYIHRIISYYLETNYQPSEDYMQKQSELAVKFAESSSEKERIAQKAERDSIDLKKAEYMQDKVGKVYDGMISGITNFGMFVELENTVEGLVRFENMGEEYFIYDDERKTLTGEKTNVQ